MNADGTVRPTTSATIDGGSIDGSNTEATHGAVEVSADQTVKVDNKVGTLAGGLYAGAGVSFDVVQVNGVAEAAIRGAASGTAGQGIGVLANGHKQVASTVTGFGGGSLAGLGGAVSVIGVGSALPGSGGDVSSRSQNLSNNSTDPNFTPRVDLALGAQGPRVRASVGDGGNSGKRAQLKANGGAITVQAEDAVDVSPRQGQFAAGIGLGAGASVALVDRITERVIASARPHIRRLAMLGLPDDFRFRINLASAKGDQRWRDDSGKLPAPPRQPKEASGAKT